MDPRRRPAEDDGRTSRGARRSPCVDRGVLRPELDAVSTLSTSAFPSRNFSGNPARSTGLTIFCVGFALSQLWLFWGPPFIGDLARAGSIRPSSAKATRDLRLEGGLAQVDPVLTCLGIAADRAPIDALSPVRNLRGGVAV